MSSVEGLIGDLGTRALDRVGQGFKVDRPEDRER